MSRISENMAASTSRNRKGLHRPVQEKLYLTVIIIVLKSVTKKRLVMKKDFCVSCGYSDIWRLWFSETVIITVLKSVTR
jgi:hypothetical protein